MLRVRVEGREHLVQAPTVLGRGEDSDIQVGDGRISRHHLRIQPHGERWTVEDLATANGTFLNGLQVGSLDLVGPLSLRLGSPSEGVEVELEPVIAASSPNVPNVAEAPAAPGVPALHIRFDGRMFVYQQPDPLEVGREDGCYLRTDDSRVSRRHAQIAWDGTRWTFADLGSHNGTFAGGLRLSSLSVEGPVSLLLGAPYDGVPLELTPL
ncbi:MAG TPA: FHA domain-containing protein [Candidatus Dormibacteraeota bacterium]